MIAALLIAASLAGQSSSSDTTELLGQDMLIDKICGPSLDVLTGADVRASAERSIGLVEINMNRYGIQEQDKKMVRSFCTIYNAGAMRMTKLIMHDVATKKDQSQK